MKKPLIGYNLNGCKLEENVNADGTLELIYKIEAKVADLRNEAIVEAIVNSARDAGIAELYLIDERFIRDAIREKIERPNAAPRGRWEHFHVPPRTWSNCYSCMIMCSVCKSEFARLDGINFKYCPHCGTKMNGMPDDIT